jgi:signal transduction histidine kinase
MGMNLTHHMPAPTALAETGAANKEHSHISDFLLNFTVGQRLTLGFLTAALITALTIGITGLYHAQEMDKETNFYQSLVQTSRTLPLGSNILMLMNLEVHETLDTSQASIVSQETLADQEKAVQGLVTRYESILNDYQKNHLLYRYPEQVEVLKEANHEGQVGQQIALVDSTLRTWHLYKATQEQIIQDIAQGKSAEAATLERLQGEPTYADTLSALHGLTLFNESLTSSIRDATAIQERDQLILTVTSGLLACLGIILAGVLISHTFVYRLNQLRSVTQSVKQGKLDTRLTVQGHDEISDVSLSVNAMLETMVADAIAYEQQKQLNEFKDEFIMNVSHELRTPLTQVYGFIELLHDYHDQLDNRQQITFLSRAKYGCQELMHLVNSILDATKASSGLKPPPLQNLEVAAVAQEVLDHLDPRQREEYTLQLAVPDDLIVKADHQYLRQILRNLVSNAFKYSPKHTTISIYTNPATTEERVKGNPQVCIAVKDTGPGIPPEEIPQLFQRFARLKRDVSGTVRGTGLGLYVCKQLVEAMGGTIWVESTGIAGEGSRFCFTLDLAEAPPLVTNSD